MRRNQAGFTLVEIAIVLVIIGLLLGGVLKGQELINSAKIKNMINDIRSTSTFVSGYQDRFRAFPGDQTAAQLVTNFGATPVTPFAGGAPVAAQAGAGGAPPNGNGHLDGNWNDPLATPSESFVFWSHVRLANLAAGATDVNDPNYLPRNADGGQIGIESGINAAGAAAPYITGMRGSYYVCMDGVLGRYAKQIDTTMDDGNTSGGSVQVVPTGSPRGTAATGTAAVVDGSQYIVCAGY